MSSNYLVFHTSMGISSSPAAFLFLIFLSTESSSPCVNCPSFMSNCLLIILVIGLFVTFRGFLSKFSKCYFHNCIHSWLVAFSLAFTVLFLIYIYIYIYTRRWLKCSDYCCRKWTLQPEFKPWTSLFAFYIVLIHFRKV